MKQNIIDYSGTVKGNCFLIKSFMSVVECERLVNHAKNIGFDRADDKYPLSYIWKIIHANQLLITSGVMQKLKFGMKIKILFKRFMSIALPY